ncbi:MAG: ATP-grasp domain-containing protein [Ignavibacteriae bacterium]|nr:ATP-grasp domain-containing protein [Ignavibacteriota bacterium]
MDSILIFGAGELQESLISVAKEKGIYTIAIDPDENAYSKNIADKFIVVSGNDYLRTGSIIREYNFNGIITSSTDKPLRMMAKVAKEFAFNFPSEESIKIATNKYEMKKCFLQNNIPCANGIRVNTLKELMEIKGIEYPLIIKPSDSSGSRGVVLCESKEDLINNYEKTKVFSTDGSVIVEEYLKGRELSIESLTFGGETQIIQYTDKVVSDAPYNVEMGHKQPANLTISEKEKINELIKKTISTIGLDNCACHTELKINGDDIKIIEIGGRLGGDFITSHLTPLSTGFNMESALIDICLGLKPEISLKCNGASGIKYYDFGEGVFDGNTLDTSINENDIVKKEIYCTKGDILKPVTNSLNRHGYVIYKNNETQ